MLLSTRKYFLFLLAVFQIASASRDHIDLQAPHQLQGVDKLCPPSSIKNGTCTIKNKDIRLTYDFVYETQNNLIFDNTEVQCVTTTNYPCSLHLKLTKSSSLVLQNKSKFVGKQILIEAPQSNVAILDSSILSVTGQSLNQNGTQERSQDGAQFVGQGGACGVKKENYTTFGNYDMMPDFGKLDTFMNQMGSIGQIGDAETAGGGRMIILADSITLTGYGSTLQANAKPLAEEQATSRYHLVGGSGGYIYVKTTNSLGENDLGDKFRVEAQGGHGTLSHYGGSGGVIIFDGGFSVRTQQVTAAGGSSVKSDINQDGCGNGAAGTLFYRQESRLVVDNENKPTPKKTVLIARNLNQKNYARVPSVLANTVEIVGAADVWIDSNSNSWLEFDELTVTDDAVLGIVTNNNTPFTLSLGDQIFISKNATLDFSQMWEVNLNATNWWTSYDIGHIKYGRILQLNGGHVSIYGNIEIARPDVEYDYTNSKVLINTESLKLSGNSSIQSAAIFAYSAGDIQLLDGFSIQSYVKGSCASLDYTPTMFTCVPMKSLGHVINEYTFLQGFNNKFNQAASAVSSTIKSLTQSYQIYLASETGIHMNTSSLHAPRIGMCAPTINTNNSLLNAAEKGCLSGTGIGKGQTPKDCSGSGGAHGGDGGQGLSQSRVSCASAMPHSYFFESEAVYEGSSGGSAIPGAGLGGNGGGIIWLSATDTVTLNSTEITVRGQVGHSAQGRYGSGGGAGGSIQIVTKNIAGDAVLDLSGGEGSLYGGGGGSGGRFVSVLLQSFNATNYLEQSLRWNGTINLTGGKGGDRKEQSPVPSSHKLEQTVQAAGSGQDGTTTQTKCFGGFSGPFCKPCEIGTYKYDFGFSVCKPCSNKPVNSFYDHIAQNSAQCQYQCVEGLETVDVNPMCVTSLDLQVERVGGAMGFLIIFGFFFILTLVLWIIIGSRSTCIRAVTKDRYASVYDGVLFTDQSQDNDENDCMVGPASLHMRDSDIWSHTHRMYMIGENSVSYPWFLTRDFPTNALSEQGKQKLLKYIKNDQYVLDWTRCQTLTYYFVRIFFPYWAEPLHNSYRRKHFRAASQKLYETFDVTDWEDITGRTVRISADEDSRLAYVDFLDYRKNKSNFQGPQLPITLLIAGNGTLSTPYKLNFLDDPLAKSLVYLNKDLLKVKLPPFLQNLNTLLDKLCFYKFNRQTMKDLNDVIEWIELGNKTMFNQLNVKMQLYVFENSYQEIAGGQFRQRRRSMPLESQVFDTFPALFKRIIQHVQLKLLTKHAEIKLGVVIRPTSPLQEKKVQQKIRRISESLGGNNDNIMDFNKASISSLYEDDEDAGDFAPQTQKSSSKNGNLKDFDRSNMSEALISESSMEVSSVMIHGTAVQTEVRIIDKSKRAYDISVESTKALELVLQKDRKRCKHNFARTKSVFYSLWIMMFKLHGIPPTIRLNALFMLFSMSLAFELVLTMVFILHIINPLSQVWTIGFAYLFILPGLTLMAPLWGLAATVLGSPKMMKTWATMNTTMVALNYPLTILSLWWFQDQAVYIAVILLLILNKMSLSFYGSKVRQHFANPGYAKTQEKMLVTLADMMAADRSGRSKGLTPAQRAAMLVQSGKPSLDEDDQQDSNGLLDEDEDSYGIVPTKMLQKPALIQAPSNDSNLSDQKEPMVMRNESFLNLKDSVVEVEPEMNNESFLNLKESTTEVEPEVVGEMLDLGEKPEYSAPISNSLLSSILTQAADTYEPTVDSVLEGEEDN